MKYFVFHAHYSTLCRPQKQGVTQLLHLQHPRTHRIRPTGLGQQTEMATWMLYRWWLSLFPKWHKNLQFFPNNETINEVLLKTCDFKQSQLAQSAFQHIFKRS